MAEAKASAASILKTFWRLDSNGRWGVQGLNGIDLTPRPGFEEDFFAIEGQLHPVSLSLSGASLPEIFATIGGPEFLLKQSIVPVVAWTKGDRSMRCVGTGFFASCTGYLITACHVLLDPVESDYGRVRRIGNTITFGEDLQMGVIVPMSAAYGKLAVQFFPFEVCRYWGQWKESPLLHEAARFEPLTDIAVCKIPRAPNGLAHQPLNLSLRSFSHGERAIALGYAEMPDIPFRVGADGRIALEPFKQDLYVSMGPVDQVFPHNHVAREVPTPGPCFDFGARIPGRMSGGPIFDQEGAVVRGLVSRSFSGDRLAYGAMLGPVMDLEVTDKSTLRALMESGIEGMPRIVGPKF